ncbi:MAG: malate synthase G [Acidimicrobiaceae bacterium]|nr:malate synthase G [Acidimicrobiaceae bacterium]
MRAGSLEIDPALYEFIAVEALPGTGVQIDEFWSALQSILVDLGPRNAALLARRDELQSQIDDWHRAARAEGRGHDGDAYANFLRDIGYLRYMDGSVAATTANVDPEIAEVAGPQLVVPLDNARYALNAANARWGSLYDALYGTDVIGESDGCSRGGAYNPIRGDRVVAAGREFLDTHFTLDSASHLWATGYSVRDGALQVGSGDGTVSALLRPEQFVGYTGAGDAPTSILLRKNGLHCELRIDADHPVGRRDHAGVFDIHLESAITTIMDFEDSVSAVDADDKVSVYRNWLGLMRGTLQTTFVRDGTAVNRSLNGDRSFTGPGGEPVKLPGRALMLVRNVGPHLSTDMVRLDGEPVCETMVDAMVTALCAIGDLRGMGRVDGQPIRNSASGSVYIVKPKMHGPDEVALACELFSRVEDALGLVQRTLKMGIMDEERRTSLGLKECIWRARDRVVFINTGFLDRTGDEIHTDMEAGPVIPKAEMRTAAWLGAYENSNVDAGLACGLRGRAQIGKGMWTMPAEMAAMAKAKIQHPIAGASTAWVPSPTAATLHAMHYFLVDVADRQRDLSDRTPARLANLIEIPVLPVARELGPGEIQHELDNNVQGILGYLVRWVGQGVGCSTVPDIGDIGLMEDLATLRISSQHIANWLHHGLVSADQVRETMRRMANLVDQQNAGDPGYEPMAPEYDSSIPFHAALELVFSARDEPNGYTERVLRSHRRAVKARSNPHPYARP